MIIDPGPVQIHARKVHFDLADSPLIWIPGHPVASHMVNVFNVVLPTAEHWFVAAFNEALPLVRDPQLADDMRGFIGQEGTHAETHENVLADFLDAHGVDYQPVLNLVQHLFEKILAPKEFTDPKRRMNDLCDRLWLIAAIEHYTALLGDFALNCAWDEYDADPVVADVFRWHGSEEVEHRSVAHDVAIYFQNSYFSRLRAMSVVVAAVYVFFQRGTWHLVKQDPALDLNWWQMQRSRMRDSKLGLLPNFTRLFGANTLMYLRPSFTPEQMGSTAQAVAYLASSPAARAAQL